MNIDIENFFNEFKKRNIDDPQTILREIIRVKKTQDYIKENKIARGNLQKIMEESTKNSLGEFQGENKFFVDIFKIGVNISLLNLIKELMIKYNFIDFSLPKPLVKYTEEIIANKNINDILICDGEKILFCFDAIQKKLLNKNLTIIIENALMYEIIRLVYKGNNINIIHASIYEKLDLNVKFDTIICYPEFGGKYFNSIINNNIIIRENDGKAVLNLLPYLNKKGNMNIIVSSKFLLSEAGFNQIKTNILNNNVSYICVLPNGMYKQYNTMIPYLLRFSSEDDPFVNMGLVELKENVLKLKTNYKMPLEKFEEMEQLNVDEIFKGDTVISDINIDGFYVKEEKKDEFPYIGNTQEINDSSKSNEKSVEKISNKIVDSNSNLDILNDYNFVDKRKVKIKDIAEIFRGKSIMKKDIDPNGSINVLNISNIENGEINFDNMDTVEEEERKIKRYELNVDDLIITCRGTVKKIAIFRKKHFQKVIASANVIVIRFNEDILSEYVKIYLESPIGNELIKKYQQKSTLMNINPSDIGDMEIVIVDYEHQKKLVDIYNNRYREYKELIEKAEQGWNKNRNDIYNIFNINN